MRVESTEQLMPAERGRKLGRPILTIVERSRGEKDRRVLGL